MAESISVSVRFVLEQPPYAVESAYRTIPVGVPYVTTQVVRYIIAAIPLAVFGAVRFVLIKGTSASGKILCWNGIHR